MSVINNMLKNIEQREAKQVSIQEGVSVKPIYDVRNIVFNPSPYACNSALWHKILTNLGIPRLALAILSPILLLNKGGRLNPAICKR